MSETACFELDRHVAMRLQLYNGNPKNKMNKTVTTHFDMAEHLRTPEEMAAYLEACLEEADGDAAF